MYVRPIESADQPLLKEMLENVEVFSKAEAQCALELAQLSVEDPVGSGYRALVAIHQQAVVGYLSFGITPLTQDTYDLYWVASAAHMRGKHVGMALVQAMEASLRAINARLVRVETSSLTEYGPARGFYAKLAYNPTALIKDFYHPGDDLVVLTKRL